MSPQAVPVDLDAVRSVLSYVQMGGSALADPPRPTEIVVGRDAIARLCESWITQDAELRAARAVVAAIQPLRPSLRKAHESTAPAYAFGLYLEYPDIVRLDSALAALDRTAPPAEWQVVTDGDLGQEEEQ